MKGNVIQNYEECQFEGLLLEVQERYRQWPINKKEEAWKLVEQMMNQSTCSLHEPTTILLEFSRFGLLLIGGLLLVL